MQQPASHQTHVNEFKAVTGKPSSVCACSQAIIHFVENAQMPSNSRQPQSMLLGRRRRQEPRRGTAAPWRRPPRHHPRPPPGMRAAPWRRARGAPARPACEPSRSAACRPPQGTTPPRGRTAYSGKPTTSIHAASKPSCKYHALCDMSECSDVAAEKAKDERAEKREVCVKPATTRRTCEAAGGPGV